jgi:hypothetical protein
VIPLINHHPEARFSRQDLAFSRRDLNAVEAGRAQPIRSRYLSGVILSPISFYISSGKSNPGYCSIIQSGGWTAKLLAQNLKIFLRSSGASQFASAKPP